MYSWDEFVATVAPLCSCEHMLNDLVDAPSLTIIQDVMMQSLVFLSSGQIDMRNHRCSISPKIWIAWGKYCEGLANEA